MSTEEARPPDQESKARVTSSEQAPPADQQSFYEILTEAEP